MIIDGSLGRKAILESYAVEVKIAGGRNNYLRIHETLTRMGEVREEGVNAILQKVFCIAYGRKFYLMHDKVVAAYFRGTLVSIMPSEQQQFRRAVKVLSKWGLVKDADTTKLKFVDGERKIAVVQHKHADNYIKVANMHVHKTKSETSDVNQSS